ncbi:MAG: hypothetical protein JXB50_16460, partial [Spirochaetes bacterium]|nr:hypothetical protein [Spirochaetota bacterium]
HDIIPVVFSDEFEELPINLGLVDMIDNETGETKLVDTSSSYYKNSIMKRKKEKETLLNELKKYKIEPMFIKTDDDIEKVIMKYFKLRLKKIKQ